eukprot:798799-Rhodomonas_salina.1
MKDSWRHGAPVSLVNHSLVVTCHFSTLLTRIDDMCMGEGDTESHPIEIVPADSARIRKSLNDSSCRAFEAGVATTRLVACGKL